MNKISGVGLGFRREIHKELLNLEKGRIPFVELAPENWMKFGGYWKQILDKIVNQFPILCHGLSLSIGSPDNLDYKFLDDLKDFFNQVPVKIYSEHLSYSKVDNAHVYDLLPIPFRKDAVNHLVDRIDEVQNYLGRKIALENVSYYTPVGAEMSEAEFLSDVINRSGCDMLLDVNNVYVNAFNHSYDTKEFINSLPLDKVVYIHIAGHTKVDENTIIDTHGNPIIDPVFELFEWTIQKINPVPVLLERDFNIPSLDSLLSEVDKLQSIVDKHWEKPNA
jgi:hypothetical protein